MLKLYFLRTICQNYEMFRSIFTIFRELLNISKVYMYIKAYMDYICFIDVQKLQADY
jgi:hypothetical protein